MAVKLIDLQLIYGVAGAREHFDDLASQLVKGELDGAKKIQVKRGDGGIDVYHGELTDPNGIDIYQCKFFPQGLGKSQKAQIEKSFRTCADSDKFHTKSWTLCLPVNLGIEETTWFEEWRKDQADSNIEINDPWSATKLEALLYLDKNKGLKEEYFKEEHLTQIREVHGMLTELIASMAKRLDADNDQREEQRQAELAARRQAYVDLFSKAVRRDFIAMTKTKYSKEPPNWEFIIKPTAVTEHHLIDSIRTCKRLVSLSQVGPTSEPFPELNHNEPASGQDWIGGSVRVCGFECWRMSQHGVFVNVLTLPDDASLMPSGEQGISVDKMLFRLTQMFRFASVFASKITPNGSVEISIRLSGVYYRVLTIDTGFIRAQPRASVPDVTYTVTCDKQLLADPDECAIKAAAWFCERFNWHANSEAFLRQLQKPIIPYLWKDPL